MICGHRDGPPAAKPATDQQTAQPFAAQQQSIDLKQLIVLFSACQDRYLAPEGEILYRWQPVVRRGQVHAHSQEVNALDCGHGGS